MDKAENRRAAMPYSELTAAERLQRIRDKKSGVQQAVEQYRVQLRRKLLEPYKDELLGLTRTVWSTFSCTRRDSVRMYENPFGAFSRLTQNGQFDDLPDEEYHPIFMEALDVSGLWEGKVTLSENDLLGNVILKTVLTNDALREEVLAAAVRRIRDTRTYFHSKGINFKTAN